MAYSGYTEWYKKLIEESRTESEYGSSQGAVGRNTLRDLIEGGLWSSYVDGAPKEDTRQMTGQIVLTAKAIKGRLGAASNSELQSQIDEYILGVNQGTDTRQLSRFFLDTGIPPGVWENPGNDTKQQVIDSLSGENPDITIFDILAYNLQQDPYYAQIQSVIEADRGTTLSSEALYVDAGEDLYDSFGSFAAGVIPTGFENLYDVAIVGLDALGLSDANDIDQERQKQALEGKKDAFSKDERDIVSDIKFNLQEILTNKLDVFAKKNKEERSLLVGPYKKTFMLDGPPSELINKLTYVPGSEKLLDISVAEASSLVPMIRLFKVYYDDKGQYEKEEEMIFRTFTDEVDLFGDNSNGRSGVGIRSFDWQYNGSSPATVKNDITAKLVLHFQNFNDLLIEQPNGFRYVDLLIRTSPSAEKQKEKSIEEGSELEECVPDDVSGDPKHYEIKARVGWAYNEQVSENKDLVKAISYQQTTLFLTLLEHEFNISQEGTFELTINYRGRIDGLLMDQKADILQTKEDKRLLSTLEKELQEINEGCMGDDEVKAAKEKEIEDAKATARIDSYQRILYELIDTNRVYFITVDKEKWENAKYNISNLTAGDLGVSNFSPINTAVNAQTLYDQALDKMAEEDAAVIQGGCSTFQGARAIAYGYLPGGLGDTKAEECWNAEDDNLATPPIQYENKNTQRYGVQFDSDGDLVIPYFFFGDLVDLVTNRALGDDNGSNADEDETSNTFNPNTVNNMKIILGSMELPKLSMKNETTVEENINLGDVPIALPVFIDWWSRNIAKPEKTKYPLLKFIRDIMNDILVLALGDGLYGGNSAPEFIIKEANISLPCNQSMANSTAQDPIAQKISSVKTSTSPESLDYSRLNTSFIDNDHPLRATNQPNLTVNDMYHYKVFYLVNTAPTYLNGEKNEDMKRGIAHMVMGAPTGLLKSANFSRASFGGLREQRVIEESSYNPLSHLADVYELDINLIGNTIFWPGQLLFMNPIGFGTKLGMPTTPGSVSRQLGLGGYHTVTQVSNYIEDGKFETNIKALWETSGGPCARRKPKQGTEKRSCSPDTDRSKVTSPTDTQSNFGNIELPE